MKERLDVLLVKQGLAPSREKAKAIIMSGNVFVAGQREDKAGSVFDEAAVITVKESHAVLSHHPGRQRMHGYRRFHRRLYRLHAAKRGC